MLVSLGALEVVPEDAVVPASSVGEVLRELTGQDARGRLNAFFRKLERSQPALAELLAGELHETEGSEAQAQLFLLFLLVFESFERAFPARMQSIGASELRRALERLIADGEARHRGCALGSYSEDAVARAQPALMAVVQGELGRGADDEGSGLCDVLLLEVLVLSHAVAPRA